MRPSLRTIFLSLMLLCLAIAAFGAAAAALSNEGEIYFRIDIIAIATAIAAGLFFAASAWTDKPQTRPAGLLAIALILAQYIMVVAAACAGWNILGPRGAFDRLLETMLELLLCGTPAVLLLLLAPNRRARASLVAGLTAYAAAFLCSSLGTWMTTYIGQSSENCFQSAWIIGVFGTTAAAGLAGAAPRRLWRWAALVSSASAVVFFLDYVWTDSLDSFLPVTIAAGLAALVGQANLAALCPLKPAQRPIRLLAIAAALAAAVLTDVAEFRDSRHVGHDLLGRLAAAAVIIAGCASLALVMFFRLNRPPPRFDAARPLTLTCPGCAAPQNIRDGQGHCPACGLRFQVQVQEPRCPTCDYSLYMLPSDRCPECGSALAANATS